MKKIILYLTSLVLVLGLLVSTMFIFIEPIVEFAAPKIALSYGLEIDTLQVERISTGGLLIARLEGKYAQHEMSVNISLQNLLLNIAARNGIQFAVKDIQLDDLSLEIKSYAADTKLVRQEPTLIEIIEGLPDISFSIHNLFVAYQINHSKTVTATGRMQLDEDLFAFQGQVKTPEAPASVVHLDISRGGNLSFNAATLNQQDSLVDWQGGWGIDGSQLWLTAHGGTSFTVIQQYLNGIIDDVPLTFMQDDSEMKLVVQIDLNETMSSLPESLRFELSLDSQAKLKIHIGKLEAIDLALKMDCATNSRQRVRCVFERPVEIRMKLQEPQKTIRQYFASDVRTFDLEIDPAEDFVFEMQIEQGNQLTVSGAVQASIKAEALPLSLRVELTETYGDYTDSMFFQSACKIALHAEDLVSPATVDSVNADMQGYVDFDGHQITLLADNNTQLSLNKIVYQDVNINQLAVALSQPVKIAYVMSNNGLSVNDMFMTITPARVNINDRSIRTSAGHVELGDIEYVNKDWRARMNTRLDKLVFSQQGIQLELFDINNLFSVKQDHLSLQGSLLLGDEQVLLEYEGLYHLVDLAGQFKLALNAFPLTKSQLAKQLIKTSGLPMQVKSGDVEMNADLRWGPTINDGMSSRVYLQLNNVEGYYAQNSFTGLNANIAVDGWKSWSLSKPVSLHLDEFNIGFPVTDISIDIAQVKKPLNARALIAVNQFSAQALDGSVLAKDVEIDFNREVNEFRVYLFNLSLEKLLELNQTQDLIVNGVFNGELPIKLEDDRLSIKDGWLKVDDRGGVIKYSRIKDVLKGDPNVELLATLLDNFHYETLNAELNMQPDGETVLATTIVGKNPNLETGGAVSFNPNIELNLLKMLYNLRLLSRVAEEVTNQVIESEALQ